MSKHLRYGGLIRSGSLRRSAKGFSKLPGKEWPSVCVAGAVHDRQYLHGVRRMLSVAGLRPVQGSVSIGHKAGINLQTIEAIRSASASVLLLTPQSVQSPNMLATAGAAMISGKPVISVLAGGLRANQIPQPLQGLDSVRLGDFPAAARKLRRSLSRAHSTAAAMDE